MRILIICIACIGLALLPAQAAGGNGKGPVSISPEEIEAHIRFLSDDLLEGRAVGSKGVALAALYQESFFRSLGLKPLFGKSMRQPFALIGSNPDEHSAVEFSREGKRLELKREEDFVLGSSRADIPKTVRGDLVYCGYCIKAPELSWDDIKSRDLKGKVLLVEVNEPGNEPGGIFEGEDMTYYGRWTYKFEKAAELGALGILLIHDAKGAGYGWEVVRNSWAGEEFHLAEKKSPLAFQGWLSEEAAARLCSLAGMRRDHLRAGAEKGDFSPVNMGVGVKVRQNPAFRTVEAENVGALIEGTNKERCIIISAHYDHLGTDARREGDRIYNGAVDNCSATACLLALARHFAMQPQPPRVSLAFLAASAEEPGLLGSQYFTEHPPFPLSRIMAALNFEMTNVWGRTRDVYALGAKYSDLDGICRKAADLGLEYIPERGGKEGFFFRSDQLSFARAGVPSLWLHEGIASAGDDEDLIVRKRTEYKKARYHTTADEIGNDWDLSGTVQIAEWAREIIRLISESSAFPRFNESSSFKR
jgi:Zn-dependent M28 family amino/carboxypeptidase